MFLEGVSFLDISYHYPYLFSIIKGVRFQDPLTIHNFSVLAFQETGMENWKKVLSCMKETLSDL